eukprot:m.53050 g.53050  ORF g.53050 m.53050 type:complete len:206 (+) comp7421_c0_seq1:207-824(+)
MGRQRYVCAVVIAVVVCAQATHGLTCGRGGEVVVDITVAGGTATSSLCLTAAQTEVTLEASGISLAQPVIMNPCQGSSQSDSATASCAVTLVAGCHDIVVSDGSSSGTGNATLKASCSQAPAPLETPDSGDRAAQITAAVFLVMLAAFIGVLSWAFKREREKRYNFGSARVEPAEASDVEDKTPPSLPPSDGAVHGEEATTETAV